MTSNLPRDIPRRAAIVIVTLTLLATVVTGKEDNSAPAPVSDAADRTPTSSSATPTAPEDFDPARIERARQNAEIPDLFSRRVAPTPPTLTAPPPAAPAVPPTPPPPSAPPLPYKYLGQIADGAKVQVFLERGAETLAAAKGETIDGTYRLDHVDERAVTFTYLPLNASQSLPIPARP